MATAMTTAAVTRDGRVPVRWAVRAAHLAALTAVPTGLWRLAIAAGLGLGWSESWLHDAAGDWGGRVYLVGLSLFAEGLALLTLGLVQPWGEALPSWVPGIGGRRIPPYAAIVAAGLGALALIAIWTPAPLMFLRETSPDEPDGGWELLMAVAYVPLMLWGPLLAAVTWAYYRRRCRD
jgi:hypothetical protein